MALPPNPPEPPPDTAIALRNLPPGATGRVDRLTGPGHIRRQLAVQGLQPGARLRLLQKAGRGHGGIVVMCGDTRLALGRREADGILILPDPATPEAR
jgi:Fe2+ transport system protein FeoA